MNNTNTTAPKPILEVKQLALTGLMSAVICILGPISMNIPISPVPVSLGLLAIYFVLSVLGMKLGTLSVAIYILLGLVGLPVFTGFTGGPGKLFGPTGGYIVGYIFMALICGFSWTNGAAICLSVFWECSLEPQSAIYSALYGWHSRVHIHFLKRWLPVFSPISLWIW